MLSHLLSPGMFHWNMKNETDQQLPVLWPCKCCELELDVPENVLRTEINEFIGRVQNMFLSLKIMMHP